MWPLLLPLSWAWPSVVANGHAALALTGVDPGGTRVSLLDATGRVAGTAELPGEHACAAVPWKEGFALVTVSAEGSGSRVWVRQVDRQGRPSGPEALGLSAEAPSTASEWGCKVAAGQGALLVTWRTCPRTEGTECPLYDPETRLAGAWWDGAAPRAWTAPRSKGGQEVYDVAVVGTEAWLFGEDNAPENRVPSLWKVSADGTVTPAGPSPARDSSARFVPGTAVLVHRADGRSLVAVDLATRATTVLDEPGGPYVGESLSVRRADGALLTWYGSAASALSVDSVTEVRHGAGPPVRVTLPWPGAPRSAAGGANGLYLLFPHPGAVPWAVWAFDPEGHPRTSRPVPLAGVPQSDVADAGERAWVAYAEPAGVSWGTTDGVELKLDRASERPADDVAVAAGAVAWTDAGGAHLRSLWRSLDLPELGQLDLARTPEGYVLVGERRDRYEVELVELDAELTVRRRRQLGVGRDPSVACDGAGCTAAWVDGGALAARELGTDTALPATPGAWARAPRVVAVAGGVDLTWLDQAGPIPVLRRLRLGQEGSWTLRGEREPSGVGVWRGEVVYANAQGQCQDVGQHTVLPQGCLGAAWSGPWLSGFRAPGQPQIHHAEMVTSAGVPVPALRGGLGQITSLAEVRPAGATGLRITGTLSGVRYDGLVLPELAPVDGVAAFAVEGDRLRLLWTATGRGAAVIRGWAATDRWATAPRVLLLAVVQDGPGATRSVRLRSDGELRWERRERDCVGPPVPDGPICDPAPDRVEARVGRLTDKSRAQLLAALRETDPALADRVAAALAGEPGAWSVTTAPAFLVELAPTLELSGRQELREP